MRKKGSAFIVIGLLLIAAALSLTGYNIWDGMRAGKAAQETVVSLREIMAAPTAEPADMPAAASTEPEQTAETQPAAEIHLGMDAMVEREMPTITVGWNDYIGVLDVESLGLSLPVISQWDYDRLKVAPCRFSGSVYQDDMVICAHNYPTHFSPLKTAPIGTLIRFTDVEENEYYYTISSVETVTPMDVENMLGGEWDLTLFTCNTSGQTRCAIRCDRVR